MFKATLTAGLMLASLAFADHHEGHGMMSACKADMETHCKDAADHMAKMKCMKDNEDKLSAECKAQIAKMKESMKEVREACEADVKAHCPDEKPGKGRIMKCLKKNADKLSEACKAEMKEHKDMRKKK